MRKLGPFALLLLAAGVVLRVDSVFLIGYLAFALYVLGRLWVRVAARSVLVKRRLSERAYQGDRVEVRLQITNRSRVPIPWMSLRDSVPLRLVAASSPARWALSLGGRGERTVAYHLLCRQRGYYEFGPMTLEVGDPLGIERRSGGAAAVDRLIVYPRVLPLEQLGLPTRSPLPHLPARTWLFEDPTRLTGVRDYRSGDTPRKIHWKATARTGRLLVKTFQPGIARETLVCLDFERGSYQRGRRERAVELAVVAAASIASHIILRERLPAGLLVVGQDPLAARTSRFFLPPRPQRGHLMELLEVLARITPARTLPFPELLRGAAADLPWGASLVVISGRNSMDLQQALAHLGRGGFAVSLFLVRPPEEEEGKVPSGVHPQRVWSEADLVRIG